MQLLFLLLANTGYHRIHAILIIHYHNYCLYPARATLWNTLVWDWCVARSCSRWWSKDYPKKLLSQCRYLSPCGVSWFHSDLPLRNHNFPCHGIRFFPIPCCIWTHNGWRDILLSLISAFLEEAFLCLGVLYFSSVLPLSAFVFIICLFLFPRVKLLREWESSKHSESVCMMLRTLAMNFSRIFERKKQDNKDVSQKQEDRYRKWARKVCACLLQPA